MSDEAIVISIVSVGLLLMALIGFSLSDQDRSKYLHGTLEQLRNRIRSGKLS